MSSKISRLLPASAPSYTMHVWRRTDGKATIGLSGPEDWEPDYLGIADDLIAFANGFIEQSGYESKWWHEFVEHRFYIIGGVMLGMSIMGASMWYWGC